MLIKDIKVLPLSIRVFLYVTLVKYDIVPIVLITPVCQGIYQVHHSHFLCSSLRQLCKVTLPLFIGTISKAFLIWEVRVK
jgi:hypothetical protein